jgi:hypothetical protein
MTAWMTMTTARYESGNAEEEDPLVLVCWPAVVETDDDRTEDVADVVVAGAVVEVVAPEDELWACTVESWKVPVLLVLFPSPE